MELHGTVFEKDELIIACILRDGKQYLLSKVEFTLVLASSSCKLECEFYANIPFFVDLSWMILFNVFPFSP